MGSIVRASLATVFGVILYTGVALTQNVSSPAVSQSSLSGVPANRLVHLRRGINTSAWFSQLGDPSKYTREHLQQYTTTDDIALIKRMGFDNVRLSVDPQPMFSPGHADRIPAEYLGYLDHAVDMILQQHLAVTIDIHPESAFKQRLATDDAFVEQFADFWRALARHCSHLDHDYVFFEVMNEPEMRDRYRWSGIQTKLLAAIREGAPQNTVILAGARWSDDDDLLFVDPVRDQNVIYNFHFYDPHIFTHQGATWSENYWHEIKGLAYPSNRESAEKAVATVADPVNQLQVLRYGLEHWDAARIEGEVAFMADWAKRLNVPLLCNEFGVYRLNSDPHDRAQWLSDVRSSLERHGIGWAMWDYSGGFGVVTKPNGKAEPDPVTLKALGLDVETK
jgi:endoglucanase